MVLSPIITGIYGIILKKKKKKKKKKKILPNLLFF